MRVSIFFFLFIFGCNGADDDGDDMTLTPLLPADYSSTYQEVRNCRGSGDHDLNKIRVLTHPGATEAYRDRAVPFPEGSIVVKEEYDFPDGECSGPILQWTVMVRLAEGSSPSTLDWRWQKIKNDRTVATQDEPRCIACHTQCGVPPDGYQGTCALP